MKSLSVSPALELPLQAVTETFGLLAVRGAGKSNAARVMAEEMYAANLPFVAIDPVGCWWGLRAGKQGEGLSIPIFGGKHGDVPIERGAGVMLADLVVDERLSCVIDLSGFDSEKAKKTFLLDFAVRLYRRNEQPLHLFLEEADDYIPQRPMRDEAVLLRAWENIVRRGRARGLGMTLITQRSASLNKNVLTQVQTLIAMRTTGPQDRKAIEEWLRYHDQGREILASLPGLENGEAWVWSPQFLGKTERIRFRLCRTLDSGETPRVGTERKAARLADIDLGDVRRRMAETIKRHEQDDPRALRQRIAQLELELAAKAKPAPAERVEVPVLSPTAVERLSQAVSALQVVAGEITAALRNGHGPARPAPVVARAAAPRPERPSAPRSSGTGDGDKLSKAERLILTALAQYPSGRSKVQVAILTGYSSGGGSFGNAIGSLRTAGRLAGDGSRMQITDAGLDALGPYDPLPRGAELLEHWYRQLSKAERKSLEAIVEVYPRTLTKEQVANRAGYEAGGGSFGNALGRLRTLELIRGSREIRASEDLFG